ncbi:lipoprotein [Plesiomonas shigelloides 302-73]|uniref:Lipoprotein n=2 Tax=Plesiomonas shigelloides TaxID=703 RepID=R8AU83_PLESH|nr:lipoprotein [Plesiomonas shigelloides 302-73]
MNLNRDCPRQWLLPVITVPVGDVMSNAINVPFHPVQVFTVTGDKITENVTGTQNVKHMKTLLPLAALSGLLLTGCAGNQPSADQPYVMDKNQVQVLPRHSLDFFVDAMARQLVDSNKTLAASGPIAVASFVDLQQMDQTNWLGNLMADSFIYQLQQRGMTVLDYKTTGQIRVTPQGDFALSRNWRDLQKAYQVNSVLTGTMLRQGSGIQINARIIRFSDRVVIATAQGFLPADRLGRSIGNPNLVQMRNGVIVRGDNRFTSPSIVAP